MRALLHTAQLKMATSPPLVLPGLSSGMMMNDAPAAPPLVEVAL
jgi:hypothetical protein